MYIELFWSSLDPETGDITIDSGEFQIKNLSFAPQVDLTANSMPVNEYSCEVILPEPIPGELNDGANLYDNMGQLWAAWPLSKVIRVSGKCLRVTATSWLKQLEYTEMAPQMYEGKRAGVAIGECFAGRNVFTVSPSIMGVELYGFAPAQNARKRLTWILFALGAFPVDVYRTDIFFRKVDDSNTLIPYARTFARPTLDAADWVTGLKITTYTFREAETEEEWQNDDSSYMFPLPWIAETQTFELANPDAPAEAHENVVEIDGLYLINPSNVSEIASRLASWWFNNSEVQLTCVNNREYRPGDLVTAYTAEDSLITGYIQQASFQFGLQARSALKLIGITQITGAKLTINYTYQGGSIGKAVYYLPVGYDYSIENPYIDRSWNAKRFVYRPQAGAVTGTLPDGGATIEQAYDLVLEYADERLTIYSVDSIENQDGTGVIS